MPAAAESPPPLPTPPAPQRPPSASRLPSPRSLAIAALAAVAAGAGLLFFRAPGASSGFYPPCLWHVATGTHCPGCGITRALHDLVHGRVLEALDHNAVGLLVFLVTAAVLARPAWIALRHDRWTPPALPRRTALWLTVGGVLWAVLRNLPWAPFTVLAP